jgi:hypothetical protein
MKTNKARKLSFFAVELVVGLITFSAGPAFADYAVRVECQGNCSAVTVGQVCDHQRTPGRTPVAVSCDDTAGGSGVTCGTRNAKCVRVPASRNTLLSAVCGDASSADAIVTCR